MQPVILRPTLVVPSFTHPSITADAINACTQGLRPTLEEGAPFALSYRVYRPQQDLFIDPTVCIHDVQDGAARTRHLAQHPELARAFASQAFTMLEWDDVFWRASEVVGTTDTGGDAVAYTLAFTPHGIIMVADQWRRVHHDHGPQSVAFAFLDSALTPHQEGTARQALTQVVTLMLVAQKHPVPAPSIIIAPRDHQYFPTQFHPQ